MTECEGAVIGCAYVSAYRPRPAYHVEMLRAVGFKFEKWVDTVLMQKALHE